MFHGLSRMFHGLFRMFHGLFRMFHGLFRMFHGLFRVFHGLFHGACRALDVEVGDAVMPLQLGWNGALIRHLGDGDRLGSGSPDHRASGEQQHRGNTKARRRQRDQPRSENRAEGIASSRPARDEPQHGETGDGELGLASCEQTAQASTEQQGHHDDARGQQRLLTASQVRDARRHHIARRVICHELSDGNHQRRDRFAGTLDQLSDADRHARARSTRQRSGQSRATLPGIRCACWRYRRRRMLVGGDAGIGVALGGVVRQFGVRGAAFDAVDLAVHVGGLSGGMSDRMVRRNDAHASASQTRVRI